MSSTGQGNPPRRKSHLPAWLRRVAKPAYRSLRGYAFDPSLSLRLETILVNEILFKVPWENIEPGPVGEYLEVVDYDPASGCFYAPVALNNPIVLAQDGLAPSDGNPQFHQQMVYAVAMTTIRNFEQALGRRAIWRPRTPDDIRAAGEVPLGRDDPGRLDQEYVARLRVYPHAMRAANAYYSPDKRALLFGYFPASAGSPGDQLPGGTVFTCLSHDIVAHETSHALLDGMHRRFIEPTNPDSLAFHEAFADIVALFQHFTFPEVLRQQIAKTRGDLAENNMLGQLAQQFGQATGKYGALRDAIGRVNPQTQKWEPLQPDPNAYQSEFEPHRRGAILVAAIFDAFITIYKQRIADLLRIATNGSGVLPAGALHPDLVNRLAEEAAKSAQHVLNACIRALDYLAPVHLTFGEFLRALITADFDLVPDDEREYRVAFIEAFRRRGIYPSGVKSLSVDSLRWPEIVNQDYFAIFEPITERLLKEFANTASYLQDRRQIYATTQRTASIMHRIIQDTVEKVDYIEQARKHKALEITGLALRDNTPGLTRAALREIKAASGLDESGNPRFEVHALWPVQRVGPRGNILNHMIVILTQRRRRIAPGGRPYEFRGGCTIILDLSVPRVRYCVAKSILDEERLRQQEAFMRDQPGAALRETYFEQDSAAKEPFALLHSDL